MFGDEKIDRYPAIMMKKAGTSRVSTVDPQNAIFNQYLAGGFGTFFIFPYIGNNDPN